MEKTVYEVEFIEKMDGENGSDGYGKSTVISQWSEYGISVYREHNMREFIIGSTEKAQNTALIIAAGADLYEALKETISDLFYQIESEHGPYKASKHPSIVKARAAINKAEGREPYA